MQFQLTIINCFLTTILLFFVATVLLVELFLKWQIDWLKEKVYEVACWIHSKFTFYNYTYKILVSTTILKNNLLTKQLLEYATLGKLLEIEA